MTVARDLPANDTVSSRDVLQRLADAEREVRQARDTIVKQGQRLASLERSPLGGKDTPEDTAAAIEEMIVEHIEELADRVRTHVASRVAEVEGVVGNELMRELRRLHEPMQATPYVARDHDQGELVAHAGGLWLCASKSGSRGEAPGPDAARWLLVGDGIASASLIRHDGEHRLQLYLASGRVLSGDLAFDMPRFVGTWQRGKNYRENSIVADGGSMYLAVRANIGEDPSIKKPPESPWVLLAMRGKPGPPGSRVELQALKDELREEIRGSDHNRRTRMDAALRRADSWLAAQVAATSAPHRRAIAVAGEFAWRTVGEVLADRVGDDAHLRDAVVGLCDRIGTSWSAEYERLVDREEKHGLPATARANAASILRTSMHDLAEMAHDDALRSLEVQRLEVLAAAGTASMSDDDRILRVCLITMEGKI